MSWAEAMRIASLHVDLAVVSANRVSGKDEDTEMYVRVAETALDYAREVREATDGRSMQTIKEMMQK